MFSVQAQTLALAVIGAWQAIPDDIRASIPQWGLWVLLGLILVGGIVGRLVAQPKVQA
jgi:hypothetical protein